MTLSLQVLSQSVSKDGRNPPCMIPDGRANRVKRSAARAHRPACPSLPHTQFRSAPRSHHRHSLTLYASLLKNDLCPRDGRAVCLAYFLEIGVEEALDARFHAVFLLGEQVPSGCHARCSCSCTCAQSPVVAFGGRRMRCMTIVGVESGCRESAMGCMCRGACTREKRRWRLP